MKTNQLFSTVAIALFFILSLGGCTKDKDPEPSTSIVFWTKRSDVNTHKFDCYVDNRFIGTLTKVSANAPACGESGSPNAQVTAGVHTVEFKIGNVQVATGDIDIPEGGCRTAELTL